MNRELDYRFARIYLSESSPRSCVSIVAKPITHDPYVMSTLILNNSTTILSRWCLVRHSSFFGFRISRYRGTFCGLSLKEDDFTHRACVIDRCNWQIFHRYERKSSLKSDGMPQGSDVMDLANTNGRETFRNRLCLMHIWLIKARKTSVQTYPAISVPVADGAHKYSKMQLSTV